MPNNIIRDYVRAGERSNVLGMIALVKKTVMLIVAILASSKSMASDVDWKFFMSTAVTESTNGILTDDGVFPTQNASRFSKLGVSAYTMIDDHLDAIVNLVFKQSNLYNKIYNPVDYGVVSYHLSNNLSTFRFGVLRVPVWLISDNLEVGILHPWIRPPMEVYSLNPFSSLNMVSFDNSFSLGQGKLKIDTYAGGGASEVYLRGNVTAQTSEDVRLYGATLSYELEKLFLRASYNRASVAIEADVPTSTVVASTGGMQYMRVFTPMKWDLGWTNFTSFGLKTELGRFILWAEYASEKSERVINIKSAAYATLGYQIINNKFVIGFIRRIIICCILRSESCFLINERQTGQSESRG